MWFTLYRISHIKQRWLCLYKKFEILTYPNQDELLNKRFLNVSNCRHVKKYLAAIWL